MRISWLCGSVGHNFMKTMIRLGKERDELNVVSDQVGSPTFTYDVVDANLRLIEANQTGTFHCTTQGKMSWYDFAIEIFCMAGIQVKVNPISSDKYPMKAKRPFYSKLNTSKFEAVTGGITYDARAGIERVLTELK
jgi:dTDP-4-dehydrorhamnose reductase